MDYCIGVDIGGTNIKAGITDTLGNIVFKDSVPTAVDKSSRGIIADCADLIGTLIIESGLDRNLIKSIGVGCPGTCDAEKGTVIYTPNINLSGVNIRSELGNYFDIPIYLGNDANCAALGEYFALEEKTSNMVFITLGTGIGGGIILGGKLYIGTNGTAAEIGHMVINPHGLKCGCGANGCWEQYASVTALIRMTKEFAERNPQSAIANEIKINGVGGRTAFELMKTGDKGAKEIVDEWIFNVGTGVLNIINILQPEVIVIGGAISKEGETLINPIKEMQKKSVYSQVEKKTTLLTAKLGNDAGLIGSAMLWKESLQ